VVRISRGTYEIVLDRLASALAALERHRTTALCLTAPSTDVDSVRIELEHVVSRLRTARELLACYHPDVEQVERELAGTPKSVGRP
jgi:hypothetical protein